MTMQVRDDVVRTLIEFFRENFREDPAGVGDWFAQVEQDIDVFVAELDRILPTTEGC